MGSWADVSKALAAVNILAGVGLGVYAQFANREKSYRKVFEREVLDAGMAEGFEIQAWEVWKKAMAENRKERRELAEATATMEKVVEMVELAEGIRALDRMSKDDSADPYVKRVIWAHWISKFGVFFGLDVPFVASDIDEVGKVYPVSDRERGLRDALSRCQKRGDFWRREAHRLQARLEELGDD